AAVGQFGQSERRGFEGGHAADDRTAPVAAALDAPALPSRRERTGPGGSPGLQHQWRGARRGAVGSTPTRSRHGGAMSPDRPRPPSRERLVGAPRPRRPSVERLLAAPRPRADADHDAPALTEAARDTIDDERARLASGDAARTM